MQKIKILNNNNKSIVKQYEETASKILSDTLELNKELIKKAVDIAYELDREIKNKQKNLDIIKNKCLEYAKKNKVKSLAGVIAEIKISPKTISSITPRNYLDLLKKLNKKELFFNTIKVLISEAKQYVGVADLDKITEKETKEYGSVSIKKKK